MKLIFEFADTDVKDFKIITNAKRYHNVIKDLNGWLNKEIETEEYYDKETLEYVYNKLWEIIHSYDVDIYKEKE
jgi:hypothetical protein